MNDADEASLFVLSANALTAIDGVLTTFCGVLETMATGREEMTPEKAADLLRHVQASHAEVRRVVAFYRQLLGAEQPTPPRVM